MSHRSAVDDLKAQVSTAGIVLCLETSWLIFLNMAGNIYILLSRANNASQNDNNKMPLFPLLCSESFLEIP
jgi:hypothetical protein